MTQLMSAAPAMKDAFKTWATTLHVADAVQVSFGHPGIHQADRMIAFLGLTSEQVPATLGARRQREETITLTVKSSVWIGGSESEEDASDAAYSLMADLENYARVTDTTIGGTVRECFLTSLSDLGETPAEFLAQGRLAEVTAVFTARARITS